MMATRTAKGALGWPIGFDFGISSVSGIVGLTKNVFKKT